MKPNSPRITYKRLKDGISKTEVIDDNTMLITATCYQPNNNTSVKPSPQPIMAEPETEEPRIMQHLNGLDTEAEELKARYQKELAAIYNERCFLIEEAWALAEKQYPEWNSFPTRMIADLLGYPSANHLNGYVGELVQRGILVHADHLGSVRTYARKNKL